MSQESKKLLWTIQTQKKIRGNTTNLHMKVPFYLSARRAKILSSHRVSSLPFSLLINLMISSGINQWFSTNFILSRQLQDNTTKEVLELLTMQDLRIHILRERTNELYSLLLHSNFLTNRFANCLGNLILKEWIGELHQKYSNKASRSHEFDDWTGYHAFWRVAR